MRKSKIIVDVLLLICVILLSLIYLLDIQIHKIFGVAFIVLAIIHLILNYKGIKNILVNKQKNAKMTKLVVVDILLFVNVLISSVTGVILLFTINSLNLVIHIISSYLFVIVFLYHFYLHDTHFVTGVSSALKTKYNSNQKKYLHLLLGVFLIFTVVTIFKNDLFGKMHSLLTNSEDKTKINTTDNSSSSSTQKTPDSTEIKKFLSTIICTGCSRRCPLSNPQCNIGVVRASKEKASYIESYKN